MDNIGQIDKKEIYYLSATSAGWADKLPDKNWIVVPICDQRNSKLMNEVVYACLDKKVLYVCAIGQECEWAHDWFDETIVVKRINENLPMSSSDNFEEEPMTTWHHNFDEGVWFATSSAFPSVRGEYLTVEKVFFLDLTDKSNKQYLAALVSKINSGWLPSENGN